jgi:UDP-N-acetylmuramyl pentapeptide phosphotransferase/UDP-N-acetylglucosamine-1-phosphate transferase
MYIIYFIIPLALSTLLTKQLITFLGKNRMVDLPNQRKNHKTPTPRGGGIAIIGTIFIFIVPLALQLHTNYHPIFLMLAVFICAAISMLDDAFTISIPLRMCFQALAIYLAINSLPEYNTNLLLHSMPLSVEKILVAIALLGFINIYNFMDGIDGLAASQTVYIAIMALIFSTIAQIDISISYLCLSVIGACAGFLIYNWHPARIFMGDVGSVTLGLICGWLLLNLAIHGYIAAAIIIPGYYLADGISTILKRLIQKKKIWQAHSEHYYQLAVRKGKSHSQVTKKIIYCNIVLGLLSLFSMSYPIVALVLATIFVFVFLLRLTN